jgi:hypothetical protein
MTCAQVALAPSESKAAEWRADLEALLADVLQARSALEDAAEDAKFAGNSVRLFMEREFRKLVGLQSVKDNLRLQEEARQMNELRRPEEKAGAAAINNANERHVCFSGNPGTGLRSHLVLLFCTTGLGLT